ncbi:hypothetical protein LINPERPRIM_LOCUS15971, partial [Linum perenne]
RTSTSLLLSLAILLLFPCLIYVSSFLTRYQHEALPTWRFTKLYSLENKIIISRGVIHIGTSHSLR